MVCCAICHRSSPEAGYYQRVCESALAHRRLMKILLLATLMACRRLLRCAVEIQTLIHSQRKSFFGRWTCSKCRATSRRRCRPVTC